MSSEEELISAVSASRKVSDDGSLVTYDLTSGIDFSHPKRTAEAIAKVFFEKDGERWFSVNDDRVVFDPSFKVRLVMAEEHSKKLEETIDDILKDIKKDEIYPKFSQQIDDAANHASGMAAAMAGHAFSSMLIRHHDRKVDDNYYKDDIFLDILDKLEIRSLNNEDLMDWKNMPI